MCEGLNSHEITSNNNGTEQNKKNTNQNNSVFHTAYATKKGETMENIVATWRTPGIFKADAQKVCDELREIGEEFTPEEIVEAAKDSTKELHKCFEWDNDKAANSYRLYQARILTSQIIFKRETVEDEPSPTPVRVFNKTDSSGGYKIPERTFKVQSEYESLLQRAYAELRAFKLKYQALSELSEIFDLIP